jgi:hypothetical protein
MRDIKDLRVAKLKLLEGYRELEEKKHPFPLKCNKKLLV